MLRTQRHDERNLREQLNQGEQWNWGDEQDLGSRGPERETQNIQEMRPRKEVNTTNHKPYIEL